MGFRLFLGNRQSVPTPTPIPSLGGSTRYSPARHFAPLTPVKKKEIDRAITKEAKISAQIIEYQDKGMDTQVLQDLLKQLYELQKYILLLALESERAEAYIAKKREEQEEEDIAIILMIMGT